MIKIEKYCVKTRKNSNSNSSFKLINILVNQVNPVNYFL